MTESNPRQPLRVLVLNYEYPPLGGGAGVATRYLLTALSKVPDIEIDLITASLDHDRIENIYPTVSIHYLDIGKKGSLHYQSELNLLNYASRAYFYGRRLHRSRQFHLVHAFFGIPCGAVAQKLDLPYVVSLRGSDVPFYNDRFKWLDTLMFKRMSQTIWRGADCVVANSAGLRTLAKQSAPKQAIEVIYNGVDTHFFVPSKARKTRESFVIVSTGRLIPRKGYADLIAALSGMVGVEVHLIGDGNQQETLETLAHQQGVDVRFLGPRSREEVVRYLQHSDLFVLPSLNEGMSNSLLEAMGAGLPVVVTDVGGSRELVDGNGKVVPKGDSNALREAVAFYLNHPQVRAEHGKISRKRALEMSVDAMANAYLAVYRDVAALN